MRVTTGGVVSTTFTVLVTSVAIFVLVSTTIYVTVYTPTVVISTEFRAVIDDVRFPSKLSVAVAHSSL